MALLAPALLRIHIYLHPHFHGPPIDYVGLAAACAAVMIATQLGIEHWFYLYIPWFFGLVMLALLGARVDRDHVPTPRMAERDAASAPARSSPLAAAQ